MANVRERIGSELKSLLKQGLELRVEQLSKKGDINFRIGYQDWYTRALAVAQQLLPERIDEFTNLYNNKKTGYDIAGYLLDSSPTIYHVNAARMRFMQQYQILESAQTRLDDILTNIHGLVQAEILDNELDAASELLRAQHIRSAGTLAGVVLERHLAKVCSSRNLTSHKKKPTLADWNDILKDANAYDIPTWRGIQRLIDIRNLCAHPGDRDPTREEVDELIREVGRITKTIL
jgi:hypothetical protein